MYLHTVFCTEMEHSVSSCLQVSVRTRTWSTSRASRGKTAVSITACAKTGRQATTSVQRSKLTLCIASRLQCVVSCTVRV